jgi:GH15 family glucan-1,4-alpha-glucosidase
MMNGQGTPIRVARWSQERDRIRETVLSDGWNDALGAFVQYLGSDVVDASMLRISAVGLLDSADPRVVSTIDAVRDQLAPGRYVFRYDHAKSASDGLSGRESAFGLCTFWMVDALARSNRVGESLELFNVMLESASPLGLYSEELGPAGELAGNYPQGLTHLGMINSAIGLDAALSDETAQDST